MNEEFTVTREMLRKRPEMVKDGWRVVRACPAACCMHATAATCSAIAESSPELVDELAEVGARFTHHTSIAPTGPFPCRSPTMPPTASSRRCASLFSQCAARRQKSKERSMYFPSSCWPTVN